MTFLLCPNMIAVAPCLQARIERVEERQQTQLVDFSNYLRHNLDSLLDLEHRSNGHKTGNLGAIEGNVDKQVVRRMKGRGRSWKLQGIRGMLRFIRPERNYVRWHFKEGLKKWLKTIHSADSVYR